MLIIERRRVIPSEIERFTPWGKSRRPLRDILVYLNQLTDGFEYRVRAPKSDDNIDQLPLMTAENSQ
jgi:hypothetical protein